VRAVLDRQTVVLADGREVRLAGIVVPERSNEAALETLVSGREVVLQRLGPETDRYGRISAVISVSSGTAPGIGRSVQSELLARGQARVAARIGDMPCAAALLAAEKNARAAGLGLWADPHYLVKKAENPADILAQRGQFAVVEGKIQSVRESGGVIYVNFGGRWSEDFTVTILKRNERSFAAAGMVLKKLAGQHVRVRGTIEERGGPWLEVARPEQIEIAEPDR